MSKRILIIDDDPIFSTLVRLRLEHASIGFTVVEAHSLKEAITLLANSRFNAILLDDQLGNTTGLHRLNTILAVEHHNTPIIMLSTHTEDNLILRSVERGAQDYLIKREVTRSALVKSIHHAEERSKTQRTIDYLANYDPLTGIANKAAFMRHLTRSINPNSKNQRFALLFIDIDDFKPINNLYGHKTGDNILKLIGQRIRSNVRKHDCVARVGGDEFTVLMHCNKEELYTQDRVLKLLAALTHQYQTGHLTLTISCSIGVAEYPKDGSNADELLQSAHIALHQSKYSGKNHCTTYTAKGQITGIINNATPPTSIVNGKPILTKSTKL